MQYCRKNMRLSVVWTGVGVACAVIVLIMWAAHWTKDVVKIEQNNVVGVEIDMGEIFYGESAKSSIMLKNACSKPVTLAGVTECGSCARLAFDKKHVKPADSTRMDVEYISSQGPDRGDIMKRFLVKNTAAASGANEGVLMSGTLAAVIKPTVMFKPNRIEAPVLQNDAVKVRERIDIANVGEYAVALQCEPSVSRGITVAMEPSAVNLTPGSSATVMLDISGPAFTDLAPVASVVAVRGVLEAPRGSIALAWKFPVKVMPRKLVWARPGSVILSQMSPAEREVELLSPVSTAIKIVKLKVPDNIVVRKLGDSKLSIGLDDSAAGVGPVNTTIGVTCYVQGRQVSLEIPVSALMP